MTDNLLQILNERGFVADCTNEQGLEKCLNSNTPVPIYIGFDCTAPSLHVGSLIQIMILRHVQQAGHKPIVLMGGGTTKIGDPSGKDASRQLLDDAAIAKNMAGIQKVFENFIEFEDEFNPSTTNAVMVNNDDWLKDINYIEFLRDYGRHFSVNKMLSRESVKLRLEREQPLTFLEFNYMIFQAYDFLELYRRHDCRVQIGGSDQWGNIVGGIELTRRMNSPAQIIMADEDGSEVELGGIEDRAKSLFGLTTPLLTTSSGAKMGKTANGAVWLNPDMLSPYDYWQFWRNTEDADVGRFLRLFTDLPLDEIAKLEALEGAEINQAKITLANEATALLHGSEEAQKAEATAQATFVEGGTSADLPTVELDSGELEAGIPAFKLFVEAGLAASGGEARRLIQGGGGKLNDDPISDPTTEITLADFKGEASIKLSAGKKKHVLIKAA